MNGQLTRIKKDARALFWPWSAVILAGASPIVLPHSYAEPLSFLSFFLGIPLLATLPIGNEFHHHTVSLWLTQPLSRLRLWREKMFVMCPAVTSAGLISGIVMFSITWPHMRLTYKVAAIVFVIVVMASSTLWTLTAKSTLGALSLFVSILFFGMLFSGGVDIPRRTDELRGLSTPSIIAIIFILGAGLAALTLWLGTRKMERFQVAGGSAEGDLLVAGPAFMPAAFADWFRARPSGAFANLIRKEFRLLRPLWVMGLIVIVYVAFLAAFRLLPAPPEAEPRTVLEWVLLGPLVSVCIALAGVAGVLSLGEEKTSGAYTWHQTFPLSAGSQWFIKLVISMFAGLGCSLIFPVLTMIAVGSFYGSPLMYVNLASVQDDLVLFAILTFTCFWCACAANGTVRAAVCAVPISAAAALAAAAGLWLGRSTARTTGTLSDLVISSFHLSPMLFTSITESARRTVLWMFVPALFLALIQSYWLFDAPPRNGVRWMLRCALPLVAITVVWVFLGSVGFLSSQWLPLDETGQALNSLEPRVGNAELRGDDLAKSSHLSALTRRWLKGSRLTVAALPSKSSAYLVTIHLASDRECTLTVARSGGTAALCGN